MTPDQHANLIEEIRTHTAEVIRATVNGKIDKIDKKYDEHTRMVLAWQATADPVIKGINAIVTGSKLLVAFVAGLTVLLGFGMLVYRWFI